MLLVLSQNSNTLHKVLKLSTLLSLLILTDCSGTITLPSAFGGQETPTNAGGQTPLPVPLACFEFPPLQWSVGKTDPTTHLANTTVSDLLKVLTLPPEQNPIGQARAMLGDTMTTRFEIDDYHGRRVQLGCQDSVVPKN